MITQKLTIFTRCLSQIHLMYADRSHWELIALLKGTFQILVLGMW